MVPSAEVRSLLQSRAGWYRFLAWLFLEQPDPDFIRRMLMDEIEDYLYSFLPGSEVESQMVEGLQMLRSSVVGNKPGSSENISQSLGVEHTRLFRGVGREYGPPPPYESLYRAPVASGEASILTELGAFYRQAQVELPEGRVDRLDYLGLELDMMRLLCEEEGNCWDQGDSESAASFAFLQRRFLHEHLLCWVPGYCHALSEATSGFYEGVAQLLLSFLAQEAQFAHERPGKSPALTSISPGSDERTR